MTLVENRIFHMFAFRIVPQRISDRIYNKRDDYSNFLCSELDVKGKFVLVVTIASGMRERQ